MTTPLNVTTLLTATPDALWSSPKFLTYTSIAADVNLSTEGGGPCRAIRTTATGNIVVLSERGDTVALPFLAGEVQQVRCTTLFVAGTAAGTITVYW